MVVMHMTNMLSSAEGVTWAMSRRTVASEVKVKGAKYRRLKAVMAVQSKPTALPSVSKVLRVT